VFSAHLRVADGVDQQTVLEKAHDLVTKSFGFFFATLQLETRCLDEAAARDIDIDLISKDVDVGKDVPAVQPNSSHNHREPT